MLFQCGFVEKLTDSALERTASEMERLLEDKGTRCAFSGQA